jgi:hypothetical protein
MDEYLLHFKGFSLGVQVRSCVAMDANIAETLVTSFSPDNISVVALSPVNPVAVAPTYVVTGAGNVPSSRSSKAPRCSWTPKRRLRAEECDKETRPAELERSCGAGSISHA